MKKTVLSPAVGITLPVPAVIEARSPSPWMAEAQKRNKMKQEL